ncbi:MAG: hypothetical protein ABSD11_06725 [Methylocella sp.]
MTVTRIEWLARSALAALGAAAGSLVIGFLLVFACLAVVVPVLAHSTWHLYRKVVEPVGRQ